jgi:hypothetical protein
LSKIAENFDHNIGPDPAQWSSHLPLEKKVMGSSPARVLRGDFLNTIVNYADFLRVPIYVKIKFKPIKIRLNK